MKLLKKKNSARVITGIPHTINYEHEIFERWFGYLPNHLKALLNEEWIFTFKQIHTWFWITIRIHTGLLLWHSIIIDRLFVTSGRWVRRVVTLIIIRWRILRTNIRTVSGILLWRSCMVVIVVLCTVIRMPM